MISNVFYRMRQILSLYRKTIGGQVHVMVWGDVEQRDRVECPPNTPSTHQRLGLGVGNSGKCSATMV